MLQAFVLDEGCAAELVELMPITARWTEFPHAKQRERGLVVLAGECLKIPAMTVPPEPVLWMRCMRGLPEISRNGLDVEIWGWLGDDVAGQLLLSLRLENAQPNFSLREITIDLPAMAGNELRLEVRCGAGPQKQQTNAAGFAEYLQHKLMRMAGALAVAAGNHSDADWLALTGLVICTSGELPLYRARAHHAWRLENEIAHFNHVYSGEFYRDRQLDRRVSAAIIGPLRTMPPRVSTDYAQQQTRVALRERLEKIDPVPGEQAFSYAHRMLGMLVPDNAPKFPARLQAMSAKRLGQPVRMLTLCAGEAAIEGGLLAAAGVPVELCIVDINAGLLEKATLRLPENVSVDRVLGDANAIGPQLGRFDIINITSGLHHLIELEQVLGAIAEMLLPGGEFWLIGEQVGRNGNQLWPEAIGTAERIFASWPATKRMNHNTGHVDERLPDIDCSTACFEGIRSQDIIDQLGRHFLPTACYLRNAFLWRLVDAAYSANFDLAQTTDRDLLMDAVVEEVMHWARGGRGTEMHAVYRSKWAGLVELADS